MKIEVDTKHYFRDLKGGDTFYFEPSGVMWIKLLYSIRDKGENVYNAVALDDGTPVEFNDNTEIVVIPTKIVNE